MRSKLTLVTLAAATDKLIVAASPSRSLLVLYQGSTASGGPGSNYIVSQTSPGAAGNGLNLTNQRIEFRGDAAKQAYFGRSSVILVAGVYEEFED